MKQLQYGCQQKLVNDFIMILLCFQQFQFYLIWFNFDKNALVNVAKLHEKQIHFHPILPFSVDSNVKQNAKLD